MAKYGEWNRKGATLSDVNAMKEYGVSWEFIVEGIDSGRLEYRNAAIHGNPYLRLLRSQVELYIAEKMGPDHLEHLQLEVELRSIKKEMKGLRKKLRELELRKAGIEESLQE